MSEFVNVEEFFSSVYLVDFSPSLCEVARKRFTRLGWKNVKVVCQDARKFRLEDHEGEGQAAGTVALAYSPVSSYFADDSASVGGADLITLSYSLSMIVSARHILCKNAANVNSRISTLSSILCPLCFRPLEQSALLISTFNRSLI
jgi:hypothetical protein